MQLTPRYLVTNQIKILANDAGLVTEYRPVYQRHIQVYRGIDNKLQFKLINADQKPLDVSQYTPVFVAFDENDTMLFEGNCEQVDDSTATKGYFTYTISESSLRNVQQQYLKYHVYLQDNDTQARSLTYADSHFGQKGIIYVSSEAYPGPKNSFTAPSFAQSLDEDGVYYTQEVEAEPAKNGNEALHTVVFYTDGFDGDVTIQSTLDNQLNGDVTVNWTDLETITFDGDESKPVYKNIIGVYNYFRFKTSSNPNDKITKILVRN